MESVVLWSGSHRPALAKVRLRVSGSSTTRHRAVNIRSPTLWWIELLRLLMISSTEPPCRASENTMPSDITAFMAADIALPATSPTTTHSLLGSSSSQK